MTKAVAAPQPGDFGRLDLCFRWPKGSSMYRTSDALIRNVHSQVADRVGITIVRGDVAVGETLPSEMQICEMMDVSRPRSDQRSPEKFCRRSGADSRPRVRRA